MDVKYGSFHFGIQRNDASELGWSEAIATGRLHKECLDSKDGKEYLILTMRFCFGKSVALISFCKYGCIAAFG